MVYVFPWKILLRSHVAVRATYRAIRPGNSRFHVEISSPSFFLPGKASSVETINLAHPNGSSTANAIARRRSAFRSPGGFRDDEPLKSVWLSTLSPPSFLLHTHYSLFLHCTCVRLRVYPPSVIKWFVSFLFFLFAAYFTRVKEVKFIHCVSFFILFEYCFCRIYMRLNIYNT